MTSNSPQKKWDETHPEIIKKSKANYDQKRPVWSFRPEPELIQWLEEERWENETTAELLNRKLTKLMKLEQEGY
jgi:O-methyltransferase involved in polyketide biosynthesis